MIASRVPVGRWPVLALSAPFIGAMAVTLTFVLAEWAGLRPFEDRRMSVAEAAAEGDAALMLRELYGGASPLDRYPVGTDVIVGPLVQQMTPLEAAAVRDQVDIIRRLEQWGVPIDAGERARLACMAQRAGAKQVAAALRRDGAAMFCEALTPSTLPLPPFPFPLPPDPFPLAPSP